MSIEVDITAEQAFEVHRAILSLKREVGKNLWALAQLLKTVRDHALYKTLGYETFNEYIGSPEVSISRAWAYKLISSYETWVLGAGFRPEALQDVDVEKLALVRPLVQKDPGSAHEWLARARELSRSDLRRVVQESLGLDGDREEQDSAEEPRLLAWIQGQVVFEVDVSDQEIRIVCSRATLRIYVKDGALRTEVIETQ